MLYHPDKNNRTSRSSSMLNGRATNAIVVLLVTFTTLHLHANAFLFHDSITRIAGRRATGLSRSKPQPVDTFHAASAAASTSKSSSISASSSSSSSASMSASDESETPETPPSSTATQKKQEIFRLIASVPTNAPSSRALTTAILSATRDLEQLCPTGDAAVLDESAGNWELVWTAQDRASPEGKRGLTNWINPLENQSYSNNPNGSNTQSLGQANPLIPLPVQNTLQKMGLFPPTSSSDRPPPAKSNQIIDLKRSRVRNIVTFEAAAPSLLPSSVKTGGRAGVVRGSLTVDVGFVPNGGDQRKVDVKFESCRLVLRRGLVPLDIKVPLGPIGPTGWLRTGYIDDTVRITRGHKGSVFILSRVLK